MIKYYCDFCGNEAPYGSQTHSDCIQGRCPNGDSYRLLVTVNAIVDLNSEERIDMHICLPCLKAALHEHTNPAIIL